jgi:hypothetical protein
MASNVTLKLPDIIKPLQACSERAKNQLRGAGKLLFKIKFI